MKIVLDTNFLIYAVQNKVDIFSQLIGNEIFIIEPVIRELRSISKGKGREGAFAKVALELLEFKKVNILKSGKNADESLLDLSKKGFVIATMDSELQRRIKKSGGKLIILRNKSIVEIY